MKPNELQSKIKAVMIGHAVGDALGVPVEFCSREELKQKPVTDMTGYGTYPVPAGAWSDDTSMSLAALDSLADGKIDFVEIMRGFVKWLSLDEYTPTGSALTWDIPASAPFAITCNTRSYPPRSAVRTANTPTGTGRLCGSIRLSCMPIQRRWSTTIGPR